MLESYRSLSEGGGYFADFRFVTNNTRRSHSGDGVSFVGKWGMRRVLAWCNRILREIEA